MRVRLWGASVDLAETPQEKEVEWGQGKKLKMKLQGGIQRSTKGRDFSGGHRSIGRQQATSPQ